MKQIKLGSVNAKFAWMLREHHGWTTLHSGYVSSSAEFSKECDEVVIEAANDSSDQPSLFERAEFLECDYYESQFANLKPETTHIVAKSTNDIEQFNDATTAQAALDEAMRDHGYSRLTVDRGGHAGETMRTDISDIDIAVYVGNDRLTFRAGDLDAEFTSEDVLEKDEDLTSEEVLAILEIINSALVELSAE